MGLWSGFQATARTRSKSTHPNGNGNWVGGHLEHGQVKHLEGRCDGSKRYDGKSTAANRYGLEQAEEDTVRQWNRLDFGVTDLEASQMSSMSVSH